MGVIGNIVNGATGGLAGSLGGDFVKLVLGQWSSLQQKAYISLLKQVQNMIVTAQSFTVNGSWEAPLKANVTNLFLYLVVVVAVCGAVWILTDRNKRADGLRATTTFVFAGLLAQFWFVACDQVQRFGHSFCQALIDLFNKLGANASAATQFSAPDPISAFFGFNMAYGETFVLSFTAASFPIMFLFGKFTGLLFLCIRVVSDKAQGAWDWVFGLLLVATVFGPVVIIVFIDLGILALKYLQPTGAAGIAGTGATDMFYVVASLGAAIYGAYKLIRNAPRISSRLTGGAVQTLSRITGSVTTTVRNQLRISPADGMAAFARSMQTGPGMGPGRIEQGHRRKQLHHERRARLYQGVTTAAAVGAVAFGQPELAIPIQQRGGLLADHHKRRAATSQRRAQEASYQGE